MHGLQGSILLAVRRIAEALHAQQAARGLNGWDPKCSPAGLAVVVCTQAWAQQGWRTPCLARMDPCDTACRHGRQIDTLTLAQTKGDASKAANDDMLPHCQLPDPDAIPSHHRPDISSHAGPWQHCGNQGSLCNKARTMHEVPDHVQVADHCPANPASEAHDLAIPVPDGADAVQGALNSCPVVASKGAHS